MFCPVYLSQGILRSAEPTLLVFSKINKHESCMPIYTLGCFSAETSAAEPLLMEWNEETMLSLCSEILP